MKTRSLLKIAVLTLTLSGFAPTARAQPESCRNCSAEVVIEADQAQSFVDRMQITESMPLGGEITQTDPSTALATVFVSSDPTYAQNNGINSFDIAKFITRMIGAPYRILEVRAVVHSDAPDYSSVSNVGTIGHR